ncbi:MAG: hypothetical protein AAF745_03985 [Planctomycetota bacterium]
MSVRKLTTSLLTILAIAFASPIGHAQNNNYLTPGDPFSLEHNVAWFEPIYDADILDLKPEKRANVGYFATMDKLQLYASRPELTEGIQRSDTKLDDGSGNRYEFGFMLPDRDEGVLFTYSNFNVGSSDRFRVERINLLNEEGLPDGEAEFPAGRFGIDALNPITGNNFGFDTRFVNVGRTLNVAEMESFEAMKTWRMEPYHYGGILEPMLGFRYFRVEDTNGLYTYRRSFEDVDDGAGGSLPDSTFVLPGFIQPITSDDPIEQFQSDEHITRNDILSMQAGFRYFKYFGKTRFSTEFRTFTGLSFQCSEQFSSLETYVYDGFDASAEVENYFFNQNPRVEVENEEFFIGFDVRTEVGYQLTKMIQVRGGFQLMNLAMGVWRGGAVENGIIDGGDQDQNLLLVGYTFGLEINR